MPSLRGPAANRPGSYPECFLIAEGALYKILRMFRGDSDQTEPPLLPFPFRHKVSGSDQLLGMCVRAFLAMMLLSGCAAAPNVRDQLRVELARPGFFPEQSTNVTGRIVFAQACRRWAERDPATMQQVANAVSAGVEATEARSWVWPRADVEFHEVTALEEDGAGHNSSDDYDLRSDPSGGLVLHYDFQKMLFRSDAAAVAEASRAICLQNARLAIDAAIGRFEDLVLEWRQLEEAMPLQDQRMADFHRLMKAVHSLDQLGALPAGSLAEWNHREQVAARERSETARRLAGVRQELQTGLGLADSGKPNLGHVAFLLDVPPLPHPAPGGGLVQQWLPAVWRDDPACRVAELELFQADMAVVAAKRERLPRLTGSIGLGDLETWVDGERIRTHATAGVGITMPLFDAGTISRNIKKAELQRNLARRNARNLSWSLVHDVHTALVTLQIAQSEADHRQTDCTEVRRLAAEAERSAALGQGDPLLPYTLRIYRVEAELGALAAKFNLAKAWRAYQASLGKEPVPGLSSNILSGLVRDLDTNRNLARK